MQIGVLGGTGPAGSGLAARLASAGFDVVIGSRSKYRALEARDKLVAKWESLALPPSAGRASMTLGSCCRAGAPVRGDPRGALAARPA